jgi:hypothetical protein
MAAIATTATISQGPVRHTLRLTDVGMSNVRLAITRRHIIRAAVFLAGAAAVAGVLWAIVVGLGTDEGVGGRGRDDQVFALGVLALGFAGLLAVPGAVLTIAFLRWPRAWLRQSYYTMLFLLVIVMWQSAALRVVAPRRHGGLS